MRPLRPVSVVKPVGQKRSRSVQPCREKNTSRLEGDRETRRAQVEVAKKYSEMVRHKHSEGVL